MNDPHVKALHYRVVVEKNVDYNGAEPLHQITDDYEFRLEECEAVFLMLRHYPTANEARAVVEPYLRSWKILIGLENDPDDLRLVYEHADIIDRSPPKTDGNTISLHAHVSSHVIVSDNVTLHVSRGKYPSLPISFSSSPDVETMYLRYKSYRQNRETLTSMAYMCLTVLQASAGGRKEAARQYSIDHEVLDTLGTLSSIKGSPEEVRKFPKNGMFEPLSPAEREWIIQVIKAIIRRVGEYAYDRKMKLKQIVMDDFAGLL